MSQITKIVITGGPCGGKSTALSWIEKYFTELGYYVIFVNEMATEMIKGRVVPWKGRSVDFQQAILTLQLLKEEVYVNWANKLGIDKILVVCDRGALDNKAYMTDDEFGDVLIELKTNEIQLRDTYDAVFHLVTAADGAEEYYTLANNEARFETAEEAIALDRAVIAAWTGHPHLRVIDNSVHFEDKISELLKEIAHFLGEPEPFEIERKFLIKYPDLQALEALPNCRKVEISQTYLVSSSSEIELRIRQRGSDGNYIYVKTEKRSLSGLKRVEVEKHISRSEYLSLMMNADTSLRQIRKTRYCLMYNKQYFEIDIYPFWSNQAIVEVELREGDEVINFPDCLQVLKEVTEDESFKNYALAREVPAELNS